MARHFRLAEAPSRVVRADGKVGIAVTRLRSDSALEGSSIPLASEPAYTLALHLKDSPDQELWLRGKSVFQGAYKVGGVSVVDIADEPVARIGNPYDILQIYAPRASIDEVAAEHGAAPVKELIWPRGSADATAVDFAGLLLPALQDQETNSLFVDHTLLALRIHIAQAYGGVAARRLKTAGGLADWQERRAKEIMQSRYAEPLSIADMARECGLSPSHFTRAFRQSLGVQPYRWLAGVRIEAAKALLLRGDLPLVEIALVCGFGDQSYFTRMFSREVGESPGAWQRAQRG